MLRRQLILTSFVFFYCSILFANQAHIDCIESMPFIQSVETHDSIYIESNPWRNHEIFCTASDLGFTATTVTNVCDGDETDAAEFLLVDNNERIYITSYLPGTSSVCYRFCDDGEVNCHTKSIFVSVWDWSLPIAWSNIPADITLNSCEEIPNFDPNVTATSDCPSGVEIEYFDAIYSNPPCTGIQTIYREYRASHTCAYGDTVVQKIMVTDNVAPQFTYGFVDRTFECADGSIEQRIQDWIELGLEATDACGGDVEVTHDLPNLSYHCEFQLSWPVTITATDNCGNMITRTATLTINPQAGSVFNQDTVFLDITVNETSLQIFSAYLNYNPTQYAGECEPYNLETSKFTTPNLAVALTSDQVGYAEACFTVCNIDLSICTEVYFVVNVLPEETAIEFTSTLLDEIVFCDNIPQPAMVTATTTCMDPTVEISLNESTSNEICSGQFTIHRTWTATDVCGNTAVLNQYIYVGDDNGPIFTTVPTDLTLDCNQSDIDDQIMLWLESTSAQDNCSTTVPITHDYFGYDGNCTMNQTIEVTFTATDDCGNYEAYISKLIIQSDTNSDLIFTYLPEDITIECNQYDPAITDFATASSPTCSGDVEITFQETRTNTFCESYFILERTWTAKDDCGNEISSITRVNVEDTFGPMAIISPMELTLSCEDNIDAELSNWFQTGGYGEYADECGVIVSFESSYDVLPDCDNLDVVFSTSVEFTITDDCGNYEAYTTTLTILPDLDLTGIVLDAQVFDLVFQCGDAVPDPINITATTDCSSSDQVTIEFSETQFPICGNSFYLIRTWSFFDQCGNTEEVSRRIDFLDNLAPEIVIPYDTIVNLLPSEELFEANLDELFVVDCNTYDVQIVDSLESNGYPMIYKRTFTVVDHCGNLASATQEIQVYILDIWPGDTDSSFVVDQFDLFNIGFGFGKTGPARDWISTDWFANYGDWWDETAPDGIDFRHADANGDGIISDDDAATIALNWGQEHQFKEDDPDRRFESLLSLELANVSSDGWISVDVLLGESAAPLDNFFGFGFALDYDHTKIIPSTVEIIYEDSWIGDIGTEYLQVQNNITGAGQIQTAMVKKNQLASSGHGKIAQIKCKLKEQIIGIVVNVDFLIPLSKGITKDGDPITTNSIQESFVVNTTDIDPVLSKQVNIYPNPAKNVLNFELPNHLEVKEISIMSTVGQSLKTELTNSGRLDLSELWQGVYYLMIKTDVGMIGKRFVVVE